jgi:hypothetical protein
MKGNLAGENDGNTNLQVDGVPPRWRTEHELRAELGVELTWESHVARASTNWFRRTSQCRHSYELYFWHVQHPDSSNLQELQR